MLSVRRTGWVGLMMLVAISVPVEAKRLGGGRDLGRKAPAGMVQRAEAPARPASAPTATPRQDAPAPTTAQTAQAAPAPAAPQRSGAARWLGPVAGMLAGFGLAAWLSHAGLGGLMTTVLLGVAVLAAVVFGARALRARSQAPLRRWAYAQPYAHTGLGSEAAVPDWHRAAPATRPLNSDVLTATPTVRSGSIPADFDEAGFVRQAKVAFIRLQAAFDAGDCADLAEFTRPEIFAELKLEIAERAGRPNQTDVITLDATLLGVTTLEGDELASVRFRGVLREHPSEQTTPLDEVWNFTRPRQGAGGWVLGGIEQLSPA